MKITLSVLTVIGVPIVWYVLTWGSQYWLPYESAKWFSTGTIFGAYFNFMWMDFAFAVYERERARQILEDLKHVD